MLTAKQKECIRNFNHRYNIKIGATRSGKTFLDIIYTIPKRIRERSGKEGLYVILGVSKGTIERNVLQPLRQIYGRTLVGTILPRIFNVIGADKMDDDSAYYAELKEILNDPNFIRNANLKVELADQVKK